MTYLMPSHNRNTGKLTVDQALQQPARISKRIADVAAPRLVAPKLFSPAGRPTEGGSLLTNIIRPEDLLSTPVQERAPYGEYAIVGSPDPLYQLEKVKDQGGKFSMAREEVRRDAVGTFDNKVTQLANRIARTIDEDAIAAVEAAIAAVPAGAGVIPGNDWSALVTIGPDADLTPSHETPAADFANAQLAADQDELGHTFSLWIVNPVSVNHLKTAYGPGLRALLESAGVELFASNRVASGTAYAVDPGRVGIYATEEPLQTKTWFDDDHQAHWCQSFVSMAQVVTNPFAIRKVVGLNG